MATFAAAFVATGMGVLRAVDAAAIPVAAGRLDVGLRLEQRLAAIGRQPAGRRIVFLGDSLVAPDPASNRSITRSFGQALGAGAPARPAAVSWVAFPGFGAFSHYFVSDAVLALAPATAVLSVNLRWFSRIWNSQHERASLVGWLPVGRWPEAARLPLHRVGVTADGAVFQRALVASGAIHPWRRLRTEQLRVVVLRKRVARSVQGWSGQGGGADRALLPLLQLAERSSGLRATEATARARLGAVFAGIEADHPTLLAIDALLAHYAGAGVDCVVYVAPLNVAHLSRLAPYDAGGLARSVARIEAVARRHGARFMDLHDVLPDAAFLDAADHLDADSGLDPTRVVAERLADGVLDPSGAGRG